MISWFRIQEMFRLQSFHMYGIIGSAVIVGMISIFLIKKFNIKTITVKKLRIEPKKISQRTILRWAVVWLWLGINRCLSRAHIRTNRNRGNSGHHHFTQCNCRHLDVWIDQRKTSALITYYIDPCNIRALPLRRHACSFNFSSSPRPVANWILIGVFMLLIQVILGGITRLTGSGLSITEWNVVTGTIPPFNEAKWIEEFDKYKQTPQYQLLNTDFTLRDFKFIFFWEWLHRFWARLIGVVFIVGFVYLVSKKHLKKSMEKPLLILFLLRALQGAVGWIMVASGLTGDAVYVKPTRLLYISLFALVLICLCFLVCAAINGTALRKKCQLAAS